MNFEIEEKRKFCRKFQRIYSNSRLNLFDKEHPVCDNDENLKFTDIFIKFIIGQQILGIKKYPYNIHFIQGSFSHRCFK